MTDPELIERANEVIERLFALDEAVSNGHAFCALLQNLHAQNLAGVNEPHIVAITMVRAGILRATISTVMACLDPPHRRGNRASVGQILDMLRDQDVVATFPARGTSPDAGIAALERVTSNYKALVDGDLFDRGKQLRNNAIAHVLISDRRMPEVTYETIYELQYSAERLVTELYQVCHRGAPRFPEHQASLNDHARIFWQTYFEAVV
jgi:hypothetical protein